METVLKANTAQTRMSATLLSLFAALALVLAAVGVYGVLSYAISQRTSEIGLRVALGAGRGDVLRMVLRRAFTPAGVGVVIGLGTSFGLTRILTSQLYGVTARDPLSFAAVPLVLLAVCLLAALGPALRAMRVDPIVALRYE
jgi:ABC-type antimicrobial peptide transport system permease subunit